MKTVVGLYDEMTDAQRAVQALVEAGIDRDQISMVAGDKDETYGTTRRAEDADSDWGATAGGAATGAAVGGVGGALLSLSAVAIPGIGPVIAAGPLIAGLVGAGVGAAAGGLVGALIDAGIPEEHAGYYSEGVRRGSILVTAQVADSQADQVVRIMDRYNPIDIDERVASWRQSGWSGFGEGTDESWRTRASEDMLSDRGRQQASIDETQTSRTRTGADGDIAVDVVEEDVRVGKQQVQSGVRVRTHVVEEPVEKQVRLRQEEVHVERRPANRTTTTADRNAFKEEAFEVEAVREEAVVEKRPKVVEEVVVRKDSHDRTETVRDTARRTEVDVEPISGGDFSTHRTTFRNHYQTHYASSGLTYDQYEPAYRYGYDLGTEGQYAGRDWSAIEPEARRHWSQQHRDSPWENFKDAVRHGWERTKDAVR
jgi:uncharacterized protein (TIGR02271 family)